MLETTEKQKMWWINVKHKHASKRKTFLNYTKQQNEKRWNSCKKLRHQRTKNKNPKKRLKRRQEGALTSSLLRVCLLLGRLLPFSSKKFSTTWGAAWNRGGGLEREWGEERMSRENEYESMSMRMRVWVWEWVERMSRENEYENE